MPALDPAARTSHRVLLHLFHQGYLSPDEEATMAFTQPGMVAALGVSQGALTGVLRRLVAAGVLGEARRHVRGRPRRLKVYTLTATGSAFVETLRRGRVPSREPSVSARAGRLPPPDGQPLQRTG